MDTQSRMQEIRKLRSVIAAGSHDFRNVHRRLAELLIAIGEHRQAASVALEVVDRLWANGDCCAAFVVLRLARTCAPDDLVVLRMCRTRHATMRAAVAAERTRMRASRASRRPRLSLVPSPSS